MDKYIVRIQELFQQGRHFIKRGWFYCPAFQGVIKAIHCHKIYEEKVELLQWCPMCGEKMDKIVTVNH